MDQFFSCRRTGGKLLLKESFMEKQKKDYAGTIIFRIYVFAAFYTAVTISLLTLTLYVNTSIGSLTLLVGAYMIVAYPFLLIIFAIVLYLKYDQSVGLLDIVILMPTFSIPVQLMSYGLVPFMA